MKSYLNEKYSIFKNITNILLEFIYPENISCIICNKPINKNNTYSMCRSCFMELNFILDGCIKCGKPIINHCLEKQDISGCSYCFSKSFYFDKAISCIEYTEFSKKIIFGLKYNNKTYMSRYIANIMKEKLEIENIKFDYILFVPLHKKRLKKRGFNQAQKIAKYLGELMDLPVIDKIYRKDYTRRLYKLSKEERKIELKNVFILKNSSYDLKNKDILIIDDIFTTGLTVNEISKLLKLNGIGKIFIMTFLTRSNDCYVTE
ncbi:ComF family protein [Romboutsia sp.]|uniref:ComF family protein n=1 Tax=Romboutsia sp. TaxID=1965302 RepID=UPI002B6DF8AC|nr:ComF family protein [Romboutsia sp.]HSQ87328.1 ComF family protein [Romboutsia sp.]